MRLLPVIQTKPQKFARLEKSLSPSIPTFVYVK